MNFADIKAVIMDMDGVLWRGDEPLPGMAAFFDFLRAHGLPFNLATNNSSKSQTDYVNKLERMGVTGISEAQIVTSGTATTSHLQAHYPAGTRVHVLGGDGFRKTVTEAGFTLAEKDAAVVVVGLDPQLTYDKLKRAALLIRGGAAFIASNDDLTIPTPEGLAPGAGSIIAALKVSTEREPLVMGKPHAPLYEASLRILHSRAEETLMIGDRLNTDIAGALPIGLKTALVLTGVSTRADIAATGIQPDGVYEDLPALMTAWKAAIPSPE
jgi:HAD superfamily hydrolase (TIGR01457 family)